MKNILLLFLIICFPLHSQIELPYEKNNGENPEWVQMMYTENSDPGKIKDAYKNYYLSHDFIKNKHTQYYKRWQRSFSRSVEKPSLKYISNSKSLKSTINAWECKGPFDFDIDAASRSYAPGAAHIYCIEQSISNENVIYAGTATAGLWKSNNKGEHWGCVSKDLPISSVYALEIDPINENVVYFSGGGTLYKSINGGQTHSDIGLGEFNTEIEIKELMINNNKLWVASDQGLYYSTNSGDSFIQKMSGSWLETEVHPENNQIIYAIKENNTSTSFYKSINNGNSFSISNNGWPSPSSEEEQRRTEIAVSPAAPNKIVALATGVANGGSGLYGIYVSENQGESWEFKCCGPQPGGVPSNSNINMMGWQDDGSDDGGQYYYDLALAINPIDANIIHVGAVNHWVSTDGGDSFSCPAKWSHPEKDEYIHADIHDIRYFGSDLWVACDGGIFYSEDAGNHFEKKMFGIAGTDFWGFGAGFTDGEVMLGGTYHNGTLIKDNEVYDGGWLCAEGGDNYRGFVNFADNRKVYTDSGGRILSGNRNQELGTFSMQFKPNASYIIGESSNLEFDPRSPNILYIGNETTLYKSFDSGSSAIPIHNFQEKVTSIEVAWSNPDYIYVATFEGWWDTKKLYRSTNGGDSWINITPSSSIINGEDWIPYDITISSENENHIWIARTSMYGNPSDGQGYDVFKSINGGESWINLSTSDIYGENITNIEYHRGSDGGVYIGTRQAVYFRDNSMSDWLLYNNNLPIQTTSVQLVPYYKEGKLRNGTNQSVWEVDLYTDSAPSAQISAERLNINCSNNTIQFYNHSAMRSEGELFQWQFPGGIPESSELENPIVYYADPGNYTVSLVVTDVNGTDSQTIDNLIQYEDISLTDLSQMEEAFEQEIFPPIGWTLSESSYAWQSIEVSSGIDCLIDTAAFVDNYSISQTGVEAIMMSPKINLAVFNNATLSFNYAYARYGANYSDGLKIQASNDCGESWSTLWEAYGLDLATVSDQNSWWEPTCEDWEDLHIGLTEYAGQTINIRFVNVNGYGNNLFIDNINFINNDGSLPLVNPIPGCIESAAINYNQNANIDDGSCQYTAMGGQIISLTEGWNMISSYIISSENDLEMILSSIENEIVLVKNYLGEVYLPEWNFNAIGEFNNLEGYKIKVHSNIDLIVEGEIIQPENIIIPIHEGWNIIPYLREEQANVELIFEGIEESIIIIKDYIGNAYLPEWNFNGIGVFKSGQGYQVKASQSVDLQYISNNEEYRLYYFERIDNKTQNISFQKNTGSNMHILIPETSWEININIGDEVYAYDANQKLIGTAKITLPNTLICLWGNDNTTNEKDGLYDKENISFKIWSKNNNELKNFNLFIDEGVSFEENSFLIAKEVFIAPPPLQFQLFDAIPNPASNEVLIRVYLANVSNIKMSLLDILGKKIQDISSSIFQRGYHEFRLDLSNISAGSYFYELKIKEYKKTKRLEIIK